ncbi:acyl carrier protein [Rhodanobacter sp. Root480]|jgi:acyl carrier protein|uniref:Acyl carrier protein n=1 Tax=Rhodanobacter ginsenosidimutans TaxID=490571 RepID=A0ABW0JSI5_9GAMM|nr:acyl carrier protein [Rhodanobacter sp. Root480]KQX97349.1 acyl carrier protein [Rhodanobacter sp. Root480]
MSNEAKEIEAKVRGYILENLLFSNDPAELPNGASLLDRGIIDSTGVLEIVLFLEGEFDIQIKASEMLPENFDTVNNMVAFVQRLRVAA